MSLVEPGDQGGSGELIHLGGGEAQHLTEHLIPEITAHCGSNTAGQQCDDDHAEHGQQGDPQHFSAGDQQIVGLNGVQILAQRTVFVFQILSGHLPEHGVADVPHLGQRLILHGKQLLLGDLSGSNGLGQHVQLTAFLLACGIAQGHGGDEDGFQL